MSIGLTLKLSFAVFLSALGANPVFCHGLSRNDLNEYARAYGYYYSRELTSAHIQKYFPSLDYAVNSYNISFERKFPDLKHKLLRHLNCFNLTKAQMIQSLKDNKEAYAQVVNNLPKTEDSASALLQNFIERLEQPNSFDRQVYSVFNDVVYSDHPEQELQLNNSCIYSTKGHPKSNGINLQITVPASWMQSEGKRPHVVQKWSRVDEDAVVNLLITVSDPDSSLNNEDFVTAATYSVEHGSVGDFLGLDRKNILSVNQAVLTELEQIPCLYVDFNAKAQRLRLSSYFRAGYLVMPFHNCLISVQFSVHNSDAGRVNDSFGKYSALEELIFNSIVLPQVYY